MSLYTTLKSAALQSQQIFTQMAGGSTSATKNFTLSSVEYQGVLNEVNVETPATASGIELIRELRIVATRGQFSQKPNAALRPAVTALGSDWYLTNVGESALHYFLTCRPA